MELPGGLKKKTGLHHVTLHNCSIGNNSLIENIPNYIANYRIGSDCFIQNVNLILTEGESCFGNNTEVSVLNETGGREVPIYNRLSAQLAYIIAMYRHRPDLIARLREMIGIFPRTKELLRENRQQRAHRQYRNYTKRLYRRLLPDRRDIETRKR